MYCSPDLAYSIVEWLKKRIMGIYANCHIVSVRPKLMCVTLNKKPRLIATRM